LKSLSKPAPSSEALLLYKAEFAFGKFNNRRQKEWDADVMYLVNSSFPMNPDEMDEFADKMKKISSLVREIQTILGEVFIDAK
jgi:hypothetical protein